MWRTTLYAAGILSLTASVILARSRLPDTVRPPTGERIVRRIASLSPSTTELCGALGITDRLVARTNYCNWPPEVLTLPSVGGLVDPDFERLLQLRPDLVLVSGRSQQLRDSVAMLGLQALSLPDNTLEDVFTGLIELGHAVGMDNEARKKVTAIRRELAAIARPAQPQEGKRVLLVFSPSRLPPVDPWVALPGSHADALLQLAGHTNAMPDSGRPWGVVSLESVMKADPDVILEFLPDTSSGSESISRQAWSAVGPMKAVRDGRVHVILGPQHYVPGPRVADTLRALIAVLDP